MISMTNKKILFASYFAGFQGGVERWIYQHAKILREHGAIVRGSFRKTVHGSEEFLSAFDSTGAFESQGADCDLVLLNKVPELPLLERALMCFPHTLAILIHDHDYYCPRRHKYTPFGRKNCSRPYHFLRCGLCGAMTSPHSWHGGFSGMFDEKFSIFPKRFQLLRRIPKFAVLSRFMRDNLIMNGIEPERITIVPPCIPVSCTGREGPAGDPPVILFAGQLIRGKGADIFLHILSKLKQPFRARIIGDGNDHAMLTKLCTQLHLDDRVEFLGWRNDPETQYSTADIALFPFRWQEPFGLVLAEAAAHGLPVAAFRSGGAEESVIDGETGYLTTQGDTDALAKRVDELLSDEGQRRKFGDAGRHHITINFNWEKFLTGFHTLLGDSES